MTASTTTSFRTFAIETAGMPVSAGARVIHVLAGSKKHPRNGISQLEMVRRSIELLGIEAKPEDIQAQIKFIFKKELPVTIISNYKSVLKRKLGRTKSAGRATTSGVQLTDLETVRALVGRLGSQQVKKLVDIFA